MVPQVEETPADYLSPESSSSLEKPTLHTKPCWLTSTLVGNIFLVAGATLRTMVVFQVYQADLLKDLSKAGASVRKHFQSYTEPRICLFEETARTIGCSMASKERHLWLNLMGTKDRNKLFLLDPPMSPSSIFGNSINTVVNRSREAKRHREAFRGTRFLPRGTQTIGIQFVP